MAVVDASVLVEYLGKGRGADVADVALSVGELIAPSLLDAEVGSALRRHVVANELSAEDGAQALADLREFPIMRVPHGLLLIPAWELRATFSFYDALYAALAMRLDDELITFDSRMAKAARKAGVVTRAIRPG